MNWSDSEFMEFIRDFLLNYWTNQSNNGNNSADNRVETYNKYGYTAEDIETELPKNAIYSIGHYFNLATTEISKMLTWTYSKLSGYINSFLDKKVTWIVQSDNACTFCLGMNGNTFRIKDIPSKHPHCHCGLIPTSDDTPITEVQYGGTLLAKGAEPNSMKILMDFNGKLQQKRWYDKNGNAKKDRDYTNHRKPNSHPIVPHDHEWDWSQSKPRSGWKEVKDNE